MSSATSSSRGSISLRSRRRPCARARAGRRRGPRPRPRSPGCPARPAHSTSWTSAGSSRGRPQQVGQALLPGDPADEDDATAGRGRRRGDADDVAGRSVRLPAVEVDAVVDDVDLVRVDVRVAAQDVGAHAVADGDHGGRRLVGGLLDPARTRGSRRRAARPSTAAAARGCAPTTTCGTPCSRAARCPAMLAYQVCECTRSAPAQSAAIARSTPRVRSAALAPASSARSGYAGRRRARRAAPPNARTRTSSRRARAAPRTSSATWTPAPP